MRQRDRDGKRDIVRRPAGFAAFGPVRQALLGAASALVAFAPACAPDAAPNVQVPMLSVNDPVFEASAPADGGREGGAVELEPNPPADAFACRRDVACTGVAVAAPSPSPSPKPAGAALPSPFDRCPLVDDEGRHFSARETRDARLTDAARCCYVAFVDCVRGAGR